jgi:thioredoxin reductase
VVGGGNSAGQAAVFLAQTSSKVHLLVRSRKLSESMSQYLIARIQASKTLDLIRRYADKIHIDVADDSRKLKNAESLIQRTAFRLRDILREASYEDRPDVETTLKQLNQVQTQLMMQVFKK